MVKSTWVAVVLTAMAAALTTGVGVMQTHSDSDPVADVLAQAKLAERFTIKTEGPSDAFITRAVFPPRTDGGWHSHPGPGLFIVTKGVATLYDGDDINCTPQRVVAGTGSVEPGDHVHLVRNEGTAPLDLYSIPLVPAGAGSATEAPNPGNCPF